MSERIGIVAGGGDCPGLNAVIRAVTKTAVKELGLPLSRCPLLIVPWATPRSQY